MMTAKGSVASQGVRRAAKAGLAAKGLLYLVIAMLALQVAFGGGSGQDTDQQGAIREVGQQPFGAALLALLALGLAGYALWRWYQATQRPDHDSAAARAAERASLVIRGAVYAGLAAVTVRILAAPGSTGQGGGGQGEEQAAGMLLGLPGGRWIVAAGGVIAIAVGAYQAWTAISGAYHDWLDEASMRPVERRWVDRLAVLGLWSRAIVFAVVGLLLVRAGLSSDTGQGVGLDAALAELAQRPAGTWLLAGVALGLLAYGLFCFAHSRYVRPRES